MGYGTDTLLKQFRRAFSPLHARVADWAEACERDVLARGRPLTDEELELAERIGVAFPDQVRILHVDQLPTPDHDLLRAAARAAATVGVGAKAMTFGHAMYLTPRANRAALIHELCHVRQYERLGIRNFLAQYMAQVMTRGHYDAPLEKEACDMTRRAFPEGIA